MKHLITLAACLTVTALLHAQNPIFVTPNGTGDGTSWTNACNLETAVVTAVFGDQIWVQKGIYKPSKMLTVPESVKIYGGFSGTETNLSQQNFVANPTIVDGQQKIGSIFRLGNAAELKGFTIQNGNANGNSHKNGGGVWADENCVIENCVIKNNFALLNGGGVYANGNVKIINSTIENNTANGSGVNIFGNCLMLARQSLASTPCEIPTISVEPATDAVSHTQNQLFLPLTVSASGTEPLAYQWFCNTTGSNTGGFNLGGGFNAQTPTYRPQAAVTGDMYYYCVVSNACGSTVSNVSGMRRTAAAPPGKVLFCNSNALNLGAIYYGSISNTNINMDTTTISGMVDGVPMTQVWSLPVLTSGCNKTTFNSGSFCNYNSDCRNNGTYGHLFSFCTVVRFANILCPAPWRVPTGMDFVNLDKALGGSGLRDQHGERDFALDYVTRWRGSYGGLCWNDGSIDYQTTNASMWYWSQSDTGSAEGAFLLVNPTGASPAHLHDKYLGFQVRCVR